MTKARQLILPERISIALTNRCNLRCRYCHFFDSPNDTATELEAAEWLQFFDELGRLKVLRVTLSGGEVFMREDLFSLIDSVVRNNMRYRLLSNGGLFDRRAAEFIANTRRCELMQISLDGIGEVHDRFRGDGSFAAAVKAIRLAREFHIPVATRITIGKHNLGHLLETLAFLVDELGVKNISTNWAARFTDSEKPSDSFELNSRERIHSLFEHREAMEKYPVSDGSPPLNELRYWSSFFHRLRNDVLLPEDMMVCPAPLRRMAVRADGAMNPCEHLPGAVLGFINRNPLDQVWHNSEILRDMRTNLHISDTGKYAGCTGCQYLPYCKVTCPTRRGFGCEDVASDWCYRRYQAEVPDFDFEKFEWKA